MKLFPALFAFPLLTLPCAGQPKAKEPPPKLLYAIQLAADAGKTSKLTLRGIHLDSVTEIRLGEPKSSGKTVGKGRKVGLPNPQLNVEAVGDTELDIEVKIPADVPGHFVPITAIGPGGESKPMTLLINDDTKRIQEKEPNDGFKQAMPVTVPSIVEASFKQNQDVDVYRIEAKAGIHLRLELIANRAGSPAAPMLMLFDGDGRTLANGESTAVSSDPELRFVVPKDGVYFASVIDAHDQGGTMFVYRLAVRELK